MDTTMMDSLALVVLVTLTFLVPLHGIWDFERLRRRLAAGHANARTRFYAWILVLQWGVAGIFAVWWALDGRGAAPLRLLPAAGGWQWLAIGLGLSGVAFMLWQMFRVVGDGAELSKVRGQIGQLQGMVPTNNRESRWFDVVSVTAGVCEEFLYRGVLLVTLTAVTGLWPAVALSSLIFGLGHVYQGPSGVIKTTVVGLVMALLTVFSGSLFVPMLLHAVIDLTSGRIMAAALAKISAEPAAGTARQAANPDPA